MSEFLFLSSDFNLFFSIHEINVVIYICYSNILADFKKGYTHFLSVKLRTRRNYLIFFLSVNRNQQIFIFAILFHISQFLNIERLQLHPL